MVILSFASLCFFAKLLKICQKIDREKDGKRCFLSNPAISLMRVILWTMDSFKNDILACERSATEAGYFSET